jgi:hypothetical protein
MNSKSQTRTSRLQRILDNYIYHVVINKNYKQLIGNPKNEQLIASLAKRCAA